MINSTNKIYKSWHRNDFVAFDYGGETFYIDGGNDYVTTNLPIEDLPGITYLQIQDTDDVKTVIEKYVAEDSTNTTVFVKDMTIKELKMVLERTQHHLVRDALTIILNRKQSLLDIFLELPLRQTF